MRDFWLQASAPRTTGEFKESADSLWMATEAAFPLNTEAAIMVWKGIHIPLSYKYDLSIMLQDIVEMLRILLRQGAGRHTIDWPSNTFAATWNLEWSGQRLEIGSSWTCVRGGTESLLSENPHISVDLTSFIAEWKRVLELIAEALAAAGYTEDRISDIGVLRGVIDDLGEPGALY